MKIQEICEVLKAELLDNGYTYGFYLNGKTYRPDASLGFDEAFMHLLLTEYRIQDPIDTAREKVGTCNDAVVLMRSMLDEQNVPSKIWLLKNSETGKPHTILTFEAEGKVVYLELTPQTQKAWYGREIVYKNEARFLNEQRKDGFEATDVTESVRIGEPPDFLLSKS